MIAMFTQDQHVPERSPVPGGRFHEVKLLNTKVSLSSGQSILEMLEQVMQQVEYHCFSGLRINWIDPLYREICLVIAEVLVLNPDTIVKINGSNMSVHLVKEVYSQLRNEHVRLVFENFRSVSTHIYNKRVYLRTSLYNAVFEIESHYVNDMNNV
jgi:hypothetical protein